MRVRVGSARSCPTRPAEWNVDPLVSSPRSTTTTSVSPNSLRWYATLVPPTPPPMTTTRAAVGSGFACLTGPIMQPHRRAEKVRGLDLDETRSYHPLERDQPASSLDAAPCASRESSGARWWLTHDDDRQARVGAVGSRRRFDRRGSSRAPWVGLGRS